MKRKRILSTMLAVLMAISVIVSTPVAKTALVNAAGGTAVSLTSITYDFTITGVSNETSLTFDYTTSASWTNGSNVLSLNGDGQYSLIISPGNVSGMRNLGWFETIEGSNITATLNKLTINDTYELTYQSVLSVGLDTENGLNNIWNGTAAGANISEGTNCYMALNSDSSAFQFFVTETETSEDTTSEVSTSNPKTLFTITEEE